jgi:hypothetical protein
VVCHLIRVLVVVAQVVMRIILLKLLVLHMQF